MMENEQLLMADAYQSWLSEVRTALRSINMEFDDWQAIWTFDFRNEYNSGASPGNAAEKANRFGWYQQNKLLNKDCRATPNCWLPGGHAGKCQTV